MKFGEATPDMISTVGQVPRKQVRLLWINDFYDGPIAGIAEVDGTRVFFEMIDREVLGSETGPRTFWLIQLDSRQLAEEVQWHELFCKFVGTHFDCTDRQRSSSPASEHHHFYDNYSKRIAPNYSQNEVTGWFAIGEVAEADGSNNRN